MMRNFGIALCITLSTITSLPLYSAEWELGVDEGFTSNCYIATPKAQKFPLVLLIQGSSQNSVFEWFEALKDEMLDHAYALAALEKCGVSKDEINEFVYDDNDSLSQRASLYREHIQLITSSIGAQWSGELFIIAHSEGGFIASQLADEIPELKGVILVSAGGGMTPKEEIQISWTQKAIKNGKSLEEIEALFADWENLCAEFALDPSPDAFCGSHTYQWWNSLLSASPYTNYFSRNDLPFFIIHGDNDTNIPVESSDLLVQKLRERGISVRYERVTDGKHHLSSDELTKAALDWILAATSQETRFHNFITRDDYQRGEPSKKNNNKSEKKSEDNKKEEKETKWSGSGRAEASASKNTDGSSSGEASVKVGAESKDGKSLYVKGEGKIERDRNGNTSGSGKVTGGLEWTFKDYSR